jgi:hypothetical protein
MMLTIAALCYLVLLLGTIADKYRKSLVPGAPPGARLTAAEFVALLLALFGLVLFLLCVVGVIVPLPACFGFRP